MNITHAEYTEGGNILATIDGKSWHIPADPSNRHYAAVVDSGIEVAPYTPRPVTAADVKTEAARRIEAIAPLWKQMNAMREGDTALFEQIDAIRAASDKLETLDPIPDPATWAGWPDV